MEAGLKPKTDAIAIEDPHGPYANIIAIRAANKDKPWATTKLAAAYYSPEVKQFIDGKFTGAVVTHHRVVRVHPGFLGGCLNNSTVVL